jgi:hypothetical protein
MRPSAVGVTVTAGSPCVHLGDAVPPSLLLPQAGLVGADDDGGGGGSSLGGKDLIGMGLAFITITAQALVRLRASRRRGIDGSETGRCGRTRPLGSASALTVVVVLIFPVVVVRTPTP